MSALDKAKQLVGLAPHPLDVVDHEARLANGEAAVADEKKVSLAKIAGLNSEIGREQDRCTAALAGIAAKLEATRLARSAAIVSAYYAAVAPHVAAFVTDATRESAAQIAAAFNAADANSVAQLGAEFSRVHLVNPFHDLAVARFPNSIAQAANGWGGAHLNAGHVDQLLNAIRRGQTAEVLDALLAVERGVFADAAVSRHPPSPHDAARYAIRKAFALDRDAKVAIDRLNADESEAAARVTAATAPSYGGSGTRVVVKRATDELEIFQT